jgi:phosphohistidine phosphatase
MTARRLLVLRHGKAGDAPGEPDARRPLTDRGRRDSRAAGRWIADRVGSVDLVVVSPALRAEETAGQAVPELPQEPRDRVDDRIYANTLLDLMDVVRDLPDDAGCVLLVGHNPGLSDLVGELTSRPTDLSTAQVAVVDWSGRWSDAAPGGATRTDLS